MRVDEAPGGQLESADCTPQEAPANESQEKTHILQDSADALDQPSCIRASFLRVVISPVLGPHVLVVRDPSMPWAWFWVWASPV